jgi:hypothetical protein
MLSGTGASAAEASIASTTVLKSSLNTVVTGSKVVFTATVENPINDAPITSGKVDFVIQAPTKITLGDVHVNSLGQANIATNRLTDIATYRVAARYTPTAPNIAASAAVPIKVSVVPVPLNVPTVTTVVSGVTAAEQGQSVPLVATVKDAGTGDQISAGLVEPLTGTVAFVTDSASPIVLGEATLKGDQAAISTTLLQQAGTVPVVAEFLPANNYYAESTSAPTAVTITPTTVNAPTATSLQAVTPSVETGEALGFNVSVQNSNSALAGGVVKLVTVAPKPVTVAEIAVSSFGQQISVVSDTLKKVGTYQVEAEYVPNTDRFATSTSAPVAVTITPLTAASFRVTPVVRHGRLGKLMSFEVAAVNTHGETVKNYTGTVVFASPTDSWTIFPAKVYVDLNTAAPSNASPGLAIFNPQFYTFTPADQGAHTFVGGVSFGKGGAETLKVVQSNDPKVVGKATFSIA